jgi:transposase
VTTGIFLFKVITGICLFKVTTGISEQGFNQAIKGLKWQAYGYKDMQYFKLKILQKVGNLNSRFNPLTV